MSTQYRLRHFDLKITITPNKAITAGIILLFLITGCRETERTVVHISQTSTLPLSTVEPTQLPDTRTQPTVTVIPTTFPGNAWTRPSDAMHMVHIPAGSFQMGSTESEIEDAITLCQQHYSTCNRWYYERESPQHLVSLEAFWLDRLHILGH